MIFKIHRSNCPGNRQAQVRTTNCRPMSARTRSLPSTKGKMASHAHSFLPTLKGNSCRYDLTLSGVVATERKKTFLNKSLLMSHTLKQSFMTALGHLDEQPGPPRATSTLPQVGLCYSLSSVYHLTNAAPCTACLLNPLPLFPAGKIKWQAQRPRNCRGSV